MSRLVAAILICIWVIAFQILHYLCRRTLRAKGYSVHWYSWYSVELPDMHRLVSSERDPAIRKRYLALLRSMYACIAFIPIIVILAIYVKG